MFSFLIYQSCKPLRELKRIPAYKGVIPQSSYAPKHDGNKKTIIVVANTDGTELFDLMAPFYLFSITEQSNVYIVTENKKPISLLKGAFIMPHYTFRELDSMNVQPDVIVLPAMLNTFKEPNSITQKWIKEKYTAKNRVLSICVGSLAGAATGIYDNKRITTHASDFARSKAYFTKPIWIQNTTVVQEGNLYSTAGVSNAVEGSLTVINELYGKETLNNVMRKIHYQYDTIKRSHKSLTITLANKLTIMKKFVFNRNTRIGVLLQDGADELEFAAMMDVCNRTIPLYSDAFTLSGSSVISKHGLVFLPGASLDSIKLNELHVLNPQQLTNNDFEVLKKNSRVKVVPHTIPENKYMIDYCLENISGKYGKKYINITKLLLDYN